MVVDGVIMVVPSPPRVVAVGIPIIGASPPRIVPAVMPSVSIPIIRAEGTVPRISINVNVVSVIRTADYRDARRMKAHNAVGERLGVVHSVVIISLLARCSSTTTVVGVNVHHPFAVFRPTIVFCRFINRHFLLRYLLF